MNDDPSNDDSTGCTDPAAAASNPSDSSMASNDIDIGNTVASNKAIALDNAINDAAIDAKTVEADVAAAKAECVANQGRLEIAAESYERSLEREYE